MTVVKPQDVADYIFDQTTKLDAPISYGASLVMARKIITLCSASASDPMLAMISDKAREWSRHYEPHSDGQNTFVLFAEWVEALAVSRPHLSTPEK